MKQCAAPEQIILGPMDMYLCPLLNLVSHNMGHLDFLWQARKWAQNNSKAGNRYF